MRISTENSDSFFFYVYSIDNQGKVCQNYILKYTPSNLSDFIDTFLLQSIYRFLQLNVDYAELEKMLRLAYIH